VPEHRHPYTELFVVVEGRGVYVIDGTELVADTGDVVVVPPNTWHSFHPAGASVLRHIGVLPTGDVETQLRSLGPA
jgi:quercetin dioxygenase-like cupin family protein